MKSCLNDSVCLRSDKIFSAGVVEFCVCSSRFYGENCEFPVSGIESSMERSGGMAAKSQLPRITEKAVNQEAVYGRDNPSHGGERLGHTKRRKIH